MKYTIIGFMLGVLVGSFPVARAISMNPDVREITEKLGLIAESVHSLSASIDLLGARLTRNEKQPKSPNSKALTPHYSDLIQDTKNAIKSITPPSPPVSE